MEENGTYKIRRGEENDAQGIADTVTEAFFDHFKSLCNDPQKVAATLCPAVRTAQFLVAQEEETGEVVGTIGIADAKDYPIAVQPKNLRQAFGWFRGTIASRIMRDEFYQPKTFRKGQAHVSFVAVREKARGHHLATVMLEALLQQKAYEVYTLDVVEGNGRVIPIYRSVGFEETGREKEKGAALKGFSFRYLMEYRPATAPSHTVSDL